MSNQAHYTPSPIASYCGNPLIEALPPIRTLTEAAGSIASFPPLPREERNLASELRLHCVKRLQSVVQTLTIHLELESAMSIIIREGYEKRNPMSADTMRHLYSLATKGASNHSSSASTFSVVGLSGMGKTTALQAILNSYPQKIVHNRYEGREFLHTQIVWLHMQCPFDGSLSGLCLEFFAALDKALNDPGRHASRFRSKAGIQEMIQTMKQLAATYFVGVLVIDELQHLKRAKTGGKDNMLNFFVNLINSIGIPVVFVGTNSMVTLFEDVLRNARRACGQGLYDFERPADASDDDWKLLLNAVWPYQWVKNPAPLTDTLCETLYDLTQGVTDFLAKFMILGQHYAIRSNIETLNEHVFQHVAKTKLKLLEPAIAALRSGEIKLMSRFDDLLPVDFQLEKLLADKDRIQIDLAALTGLAPKEDTARAVEEASPARRSARQRTPTNPSTVSSRINAGVDTAGLLEEEGWLLGDVLEFSNAYRRAA
jgi:hypothetical protein